MNASQLLILGVPGPELTSDDAALYRELQPGGFILFTRNIVDAAQVRRLTDDLRALCTVPPVICIDNEGGRVWRTAPFAPAPPSADRFRRAGDPKLIAQAGFLTGRLLRLLGINLNLAPVLDIDAHPDAQNALRGRCWGHRDQEVLTNAGIFNRHQRRQRVLGCAKHFPAGGRAVTDPHHALPVVDATIDEMQRADLIPYTALMPELDAIMISHLHFPRIDPDQLPASLSSNIINGLLRTRLGFDHHLVLTDDLDMGAIQNHYGTPAAARMSILAGADMLLLCHEFARAGESLAALDDIPEPIRSDALARIDRAKARFATPLPFKDDTLAEIIRGLEQLRADTPGEDEDSPAQSPVEDY
ncbi:MAG: glycoside hydrolase family 3 protein [Akkermansiaceae bacterium]|nr:glycoside hydrolase family 3 protein [Akkermansiaceae bacterium]